MLKCDCIGCAQVTQQQTQISWVKCQLQKAKAAESYTCLSSTAYTFSAATCSMHAAFSTLYHACLTDCCDYKHTAMEMQHVPDTCDLEDKLQEKTCTCSCLPSKDAGWRPRPGTDPSTCCRKAWGPSTWQVAASTSLQAPLRGELCSSACPGPCTGCRLCSRPCSSCPKKLLPSSGPIVSLQASHRKMSCTGECCFGPLP